MEMLKFMKFHTDLLEAVNTAYIVSMIVEDGNVVCHKNRIKSEKKLLLFIIAKS